MFHFLPNDKVIVPPLRYTAVIKNVSERYTTMSLMGLGLLLLHVFDGAEWRPATLNDVDYNYADLYFVQHRAQGSPVLAVAIAVCYYYCCRHHHHHPRGRHCQAEFAVCRLRLSLMGRSDEWCLLNTGRARARPIVLIIMIVALAVAAAAVKFKPI